MLSVKNIFKSLIAAAIVLLPACSETDPDPVPRELAFEARSEVMTKGFVTGTDLVDASSGARNIIISAYLHAQSGEDGNYLVAETFLPSAGRWHHEPALYWPMGGTLDFLAYSAATPLADSDVTWGVPSAAGRMRLAVDASRRQDDILYAAAYGSASSGDEAMPLTMHHAQAWLDIRLSKDPGCSATVVVSSVTVSDIFLAGDLEVVNDHGVAEASWSFRRSVAADTPVDDPASVLGMPLTPAEASLSMLIPEQEMTALTVSYTVDGAPGERTVALPHANWIMGRHYVYSFIFNPSGGEGDAWSETDDRPWPAGAPYSPYLRFD